MQLFPLILVAMHGMGSLHHIVLALVAGHGAAVHIDDRGRVFAELQVLQLPLQIPSVTASMCGASARRDAQRVRGVPRKKTKRRRQAERELAGELRRSL